MADQNLGAYNIADRREIALRRVPKGLFEFIDRGTEDEVALRNNRVAGLGAEYLQFSDPVFRPVGHGRPSLKLLDSNRAVAEG